MKNHALKMKRQMVKAVLLNELEEVNRTLDGCTAGEVLTDVEKLQFSTAFAALAKLVMRLP
jgi:hypothetical protein